ncbi:hypothetical protein HK096_011167, partial [Nowakowskiella sp. JEL0078]
MAKSNKLLLTRNIKRTTSPLHNELSDQMDMDTTDTPTSLPESLTWIRQAVSNEIKNVVSIGVMTLSVEEAAQIEAEIMEEWMGNWSQEDKNVIDSKDIDEWIQNEEKWVENEAEG